MKFKEGDKVKNIINGRIGEIVHIDKLESETNTRYGKFNDCYFVKYDTNHIWQTIVEIEKVPEILDEKEKEYLSNVIKPFKSDIVYIAKVKVLIGEHHYINIKLKNNDMMNFPNLKNNNMYKGMEEEKAYTLKELNLE